MLSQYVTEILFLALPLFFKPVKELSLHLAHDIKNLVAIFDRFNAVNLKIGEILGQRNRRNTYPDLPRRLKASVHPIEIFFVCFESRLIPQRLWNRLTFGGLKGPLILPPLYLPAEELSEFFAISWTSATLKFAKSLACVRRSAYSSGSAVISLRAFSSVYG